MWSSSSKSKPLHNCCNDQGNDHGQEYEIADVKFDHHDGVLCVLQLTQDTQDDTTWTNFILYPHKFKQEDV